MKILIKRKIFQAQALQNYNYFDGVVCAETLKKYATEAEKPEAYHTYNIGKRVVNAPQGYIKLFQNDMRSHLRLPYTNYAYAYVKRKGLLHALNIHRGQPTIVHLDITSFFRSITLKNVTQVLDLLCIPRTWVGAGILQPNQPHFTDESVHDLARCFCYKGALAVGSPISPALSNTAMFAFDRAIGTALKRRGINYTRYADDIILSGRRAHRYIDLVYNFMHYHGLRPNTKKTRIMHSNNRQEVFGLILNEIKSNKRVRRPMPGITSKAVTQVCSVAKCVFMPIRVNREYKRRVRAARHQLKLQEENAVRQEGMLDYNPEDEKVIQGKESWIKFVHNRGKTAIIERDQWTYKSHY